MSPLWLMVRRSLRRHALSSVVTVVSAALACGLVMLVFSLSEQSRRAFGRGGLGFDALVGAKGSPTQLVLSAVYHLDTSPGNVSWSWVERLRGDPRVATALPMALGDGLRGLPVVGTTAELFGDDVEADRGTDEPRELVLAAGRAFASDRREAVLGASAAERLGLALNDTFRPTHGVAEGSHAHEEIYRVVGRFAPTGSPLDRVVWIPIEGIYHMQGHVGRDEEGHEHHVDEAGPIPPAYREVSAVLLKLRGGAAGFSLAQEINRGDEALLVWPIAATMAELVDDLGWVNRILEWVAVLVVVVAGACLFASLWNTMRERSSEFAVLRALGARRGLLVSALLAESSALALAGVVLGYGVYAVLLRVSAGIVAGRTGLALDLSLVHPALLWTPLAMLAVGLVAGLLPALRAYRTDVLRILSRV